MPKKNAIMRVEGDHVSEPRVSATDIATILHDSTDRLNAVIAEAEKKFTALNLGVDTFVEFDDKDDDGYRTFLRFGRVDKDWHLLIATDDVFTEPDEISVWQLLANASRPSRARAVGALEALHARMVELALQQALDLRDRVADAEAFLSSLGEK